MGFFKYPVEPVSATITAGPIQFVDDGVDTEVSKDTGTPANSNPLPVEILSGGVPVTPLAPVYDYGVATTALRTAAQIGNPTGVADFNTGAPGAQTLRTVISSRSEALTTPLAAQLSNGSAALAYGSGADGGTVLRVTISTRSEAVATPLAAQLSNGTSAIAYGTGADGATVIRTTLSTRAESVTTPLAAQLSNGSAAIAYGSGADGATVIRTTLSTRAENLATPLAAQLSNGSAALAYGTGADGGTVLRVTISTRSEAATTPLAVRLTNGTSFILPNTPTSGRSLADSVRKDYSSGSVTTGAWVQIVASLATTANLIEIFDSSGQTMELGLGPAASEVRACIITPGGNGQVPLTIASGTRVSVRAISGTASVGELDINFYT